MQSLVLPAASMTSPCEDRLASRGREGLPQTVTLTLHIMGKKWKGISLLSPGSGSGFLTGLFPTAQKNLSLLERGETEARPGRAITWDQRASGSCARRHLAISTPSPSCPRADSCIRHSLGLWQVLFSYKMSYQMVHEIKLWCLIAHFLFAGSLRAVFLAFPGGRIKYWRNQ